MMEGEYLRISCTFCFLRVVVVASKSAARFLTLGFETGNALYERLLTALIETAALTTLLKSFHLSGQGSLLRRLIL